MYCFTYFTLLLFRNLKKNLNAFKPSEHPPNMGVRCQNVYVRGNISGTAAEAPAIKYLRDSVTGLHGCS